MFSISLFAQEFNQLDSNGKKQGLWKGVYEESKRPRYEGTFEHGKEVGMFKFFDDTKAGTVTTGTMLDGQPQFETNVLKGAAKAAALNTLPELQKGEQYAFDNNQNVIGIVNANGALQSLAARRITMILY